MTGLEIKLYFDKHVSIRDINAFKNFLKNKPDEIAALLRFENPIWRTGFDNYDYVYSIFFDYLKEKYGKEKLGQGIKKGTPENQVTKKIFEEDEKENPCAETLAKTFGARFI